MNKDYTANNSKIIDSWVENGWEWGKPITHEQYEEATKGNWEVVLTPVKTVPKSWFPKMQGIKILGLASGGGQQMPIFSAAGANCTVLDYSLQQLEQEKIIAERENYEINIIHGDMSKVLPFENNSFDMIFHPVSNCFVADIQHIWNECFRVLKPGGILLAGWCMSIVYAFDDEEERIERKLPFNPLEDEELYDLSIKNDWGIQFSHTFDEQIAGQLKAGFILKDIYEDTAGSGKLHEYNIPTFMATYSQKPMN